MRRRALLLGLAALVTTLFWLDRHPVRLPSSGPRVAAGIQARNEGHAVLLVVDFDALKNSRPRELRQRWADLEWDNILTQGFGGCDIADLEELESAIHDREFVVLGRRTARRLSPAHFRILSRRVDEGLEVFIEAPDSSLCKRFGLELAAVERRQKLPWPRPMIPMGDLTPSLRPTDVPVPWTRLRYVPQLRATKDRPRIHLSLDGRPMGWVREQGRGAWIILAMDFAELSTRLRQGAPSATLELHGRGGTPEPSTSDLVASPALLVADDAWLDAWVEGICGAALTHKPLTRISTAPWSADGWLIVSEEYTATGTPAPELPEIPGRPISTFVLAPPPGPVAGPGGAGLLSRWPGPTLFANRLDHPVRSIGLGWIRPLARPPSLAEQARALEDATGVAPRINRNLRSLWSENPDRCFEEILGAGIRVDTSFGPPPGTAGWLFGSGVPFAPLATSGLGFALTEIPFHSRIIDRPPDEARLDRWLRRNARGGASPVQIAFDDRRGGMDSGEFAKLAELAQRNRHRVRTAEELADWWELRSQLILRRRPTVDGVEISIGEIPDGGFAVLVPVRWRDRALAGWAADWGVARSRKARRFDRGYRLIELGPGASGGRLRLDYH